MRGLKTVMAAGLIFLAACASNTGTRGPSGVVLPDTIVGIGRDMSGVTAIHKAKIDAVNKAVGIFLGERQFQLYETQLRAVILNTPTPDRFIFKETLQNLGLRKEDGFSIYELEMKINWPAIRQVLVASRIPLRNEALAAAEPTTGGTTSGNSDNLSPAARRARELVTGESGGTTTTPSGTPGTSGTSGSPTAAPGAGTPGSLEVTADDWGTATPEEQSVIRRYVDTMTYMVYFNDESNEDPALMKAAVTKMNELLAQRTLETIDLAQIEKIKKDQKTIYEESSGGDVSFIQWIAQKLNADIYVEIDATTTGRTIATSRHQGAVNLNIKLFDPSTAQLLGAVPYSSDEMVSSKNIQDAQITAIQSSLVQVMPRAIEQAKRFMQKTLTRGIKYELILQNTADSRLMSRFRTALARRVKAVNVITSSPEETRYEIYYIGLVADLEDLIYQVTDTLPGLEGMNKVVQRGKSLTMTTGL